ncbi:MAG: aminoglycoside adenylyltransferase domain-containing protein [Candidatus Sulfotelmatobacter sp.]
MTLAKNIPTDLSELLQAMAADLPLMLRGDLVGIYLWGSLTYDAFDATCSDVDLVAVTARDLDDREFSELDEWLKKKENENPWVKRIDMRFVIDGEFLDKTSRCCGFYHCAGKLVRHGSDGNPIIWMNVAQCGVTLWGKDAKTIAPYVSGQCLNDALLLELNYLKEDLRFNSGDRSEKAFVHNAYAVLTACRILYTAHHGKLTSKDQACQWAMKMVPPIWRSVTGTARENRIKNSGSTTSELEDSAKEFVGFVANEVNRIMGNPVRP